MAKKKLKKKTTKKKKSAKRKAVNPGWIQVSHEDGNDVFTWTGSENPPKTFNLPTGTTNFSTIILKNSDNTSYTGSTSTTFCDTVSCKTEADVTKAGRIGFAIGVIVATLSYVSFLLLDSLLTF